MGSHLASEPPRRSAPFDVEPGFYEPARLWLYGNARLLGRVLACVPEAFGPPSHDPSGLAAVEREAERLVLDGRVLVVGVHNLPHRRSALAPLRWGAPRIVVLSGGFRHHLGRDLKTEPFREARLWRSEFDVRTDLAVSRRAPDALPTFSLHNRAVDRLVSRIARGEVPGTLFGNPRFVLAVRGWAEVGER